MNETANEKMGSCTRIYDSWMDFKDEYELPYVDTETYAIIKNAYFNIDFFGKFWYIIFGGYIFFRLYSMFRVFT